jgi:glycosyltransferase involved in cell wall biosynthesis
MKILQVISAFAPAYSYGGPVKVTYETAKRLAARGHDVTVYTTDACDSRNRLTYEQNPVWMDGIEVYRFKNLSNKLAYGNFAVAPAIARALSRNTAKYNIVHMREYRTMQTILATYYARKYNVPFVVQAHGSIPHDVGALKISKRLFDAIYGLRALRSASKIIALNEMEFAQYRRLGIDKHKIEIVPNGVDLPSDENASRKGAFRRKFGIRNDEKIVMFLGRIHKIKGLDLLLEAFSGLLGEMPSVRLVIAGPDAGFLPFLIKQTKKLKVKDNVLFPGPLYGAEKLEAFKDADVFVLPSTYETFPNAVLEACSLGVPVIVTDRCGIAELVRKNGLVVKYDRDELREAIETMLANDQLRKTLGTDCKNYVISNLSWQKIVEKLETVYRAVIENAI